MKYMRARALAPPFSRVAPVMATGSGADFADQESLPLHAQSVVRARIPRFHSKAAKGVCVCVCVCVVCVCVCVCVSC